MSSVYAHASLMRTSEIGQWMTGFVLPFAGPLLALLFSGGWVVLSPGGSFAIVLINATAFALLYQKVRVRIPYFARGALAGNIGATFVFLLSFYLFYFQR